MFQYPLNTKKTLMISLLVCLSVFTACSEDGHVKNIIQKTDLVIEAGVNNIITKCLFDGQDGYLYAGELRDGVAENREAPEGEQT